MDIRKKITQLEILALSSQEGVEIEDTKADSFVAGLYRDDDFEIWGYNDRLGFDIEGLIRKGIDEFGLNPYLVLDLGCGVGNFLRQISKIEGVKALGIDRYLRTYKGEFLIPREQFIVGDFANLDGKVGKNTVPYVLDKIPDNSFHLIVASRSNKFPSNLYPTYLNQIARILAPNGFAAIELSNLGPKGSNLKEYLDEFEANYSEHFCVKPSPINPEESVVLEIGRY